MYGTGCLSLAPQMDFPPGGEGDWRFRRWSLLPGLPGNSHLQTGDLGFSASGGPKPDTVLPVGSGVLGLAGAISRKLRPSGNLQELRLTEGWSQTCSEDLLAEAKGKRVRRVLSSKPLKIEVSCEDAGTMLGVTTTGLGTYASEATRMYRYTAKTRAR
jgi:hypothetical protein